MPPELPQIETGEGASTFQTPPTVGVQRLDVDRPNPALTAIREQGAAVASKANYLAVQIKQQQIANQALGAESDYVTKSTNLETSLEKVTDPATKLKLYQTGLQGIHDDILARNPDIAPQIQGQLGIRMAESLRNANHQYVIDAHGQAANDIKSKMQDSLIAITNAPDQQTANQLQNNTHQWMEHTAENGFFQKHELDPIMQEFDYKVKYALFDKLAGMHPNEALSMPLSKTGLEEKDYRTITDRAIDDIYKGRKIADLGRIEQEVAYTNRFNANQTTPEEDNDAAEHGYLSIANYKSRYGRPPTDVQSEGEYHNLAQQINDFDGDSIAFSTWMIDHVVNNTNLKGDARQATLATGRLRLQELNSAAGIANQESNFAVKQFAYKNYPNIYNMKLPNDPFGGVRRQINLVLTGLPQRLKFAKTEEDRQRIRDESIKEIQTLGDPTRPAPREVMPSPTAPTAPAPAAITPSGDMPSSSVTGGDSEAPVSNAGLR